MSNMEILVIALLCVVIILLVGIFVYLFSKKSISKDEMEVLIVKKLDDSNTKLSSNIQDKLEESNSKLSNNLQDKIDENKNSVKNLSSNIVEQFNSLDSNVNTHNKETLKKTMDTFSKVNDRLEKIDKSQKSIDELSKNIVDLESILGDNKVKGAFGEVLLSNVLSSIFGDMRKYYELDSTLSNGHTADAIINFPAPVGRVCIDSKFPLENYRKLADNATNEEKRKISAAAFKADLKRHIDNISDRYIIHGETAKQAVMFVPAEAVFSYMHSGNLYNDIILYANNKRVWVASPTTLMSILFTASGIIKDIERTKSANMIHKGLGSLENNFKLYESRWLKILDDIERLGKDAKDFDISVGKTGRDFAKITRLKIENSDDVEDVIFSDSDFFDIPDEIVARNNAGELPTDEDSDSTSYVTGNTKFIEDEKKGNDGDNLKIFDESSNLFNEQAKTFSDEDNAFNESRKSFNNEDISFNESRKTFSDEDNAFNESRKSFNNEDISFNKSRKTFSDEDDSFDEPRNSIDKKGKSFKDSRNISNDVDDDSDDSYDDMRSSFTGGGSSFNFNNVDNSSKKEKAQKDNSKESRERANSNTGNIYDYTVSKENTESSKIKKETSNKAKNDFDEPKKEVRKEAIKEEVKEAVKEEVKETKKDDKKQDDEYRYTDNGFYYKQF